MTRVEMNPVLMIRSDYFLLRNLAPLVQQRDEPSLSGELSRAILLQDDAFPKHAVRLYSHVVVLDANSGTEHRFCIVTPEEENEAAQKLSVLAPMATAIIGFRKGEEVSWPFPDGMKRLKIVDVQNETMSLTKPSVAGLPIQQ